MKYADVEKRVAVTTGAVVERDSRIIRTRGAAATARTHLHVHASIEHDVRPLARLLAVARDRRVLTRLHQRPYRVHDAQRRVRVDERLKAIPYEAMSGWS